MAFLVSVCVCVCVCVKSETQACIWASIVVNVRLEVVALMYLCHRASAIALGGAE